MTSSVPSGRSTSLPRWNVAPARTRATRWGALTERQRDWAASMSLNAIARPAAREPGPLVTLLRCRTVANVDSIGGAQIDPVLGRVVVELQQHVQVVDDLRDGLGELGAVVDSERLRGDPGVLAVLGFEDLLHRPGRRRVGRFRH